VKQFLVSAISIGARLIAPLCTKMRFIPILALLLLTIQPIRAYFATPEESIPNTRQVWAFYLSFWAGESTWNWQESVLDDTPTIGLYNSKLPAIAATHIEQAKSAGISSFIVSWFGIDEIITTTPALINLLDRAHEQHFKIGVAIDIFVGDFHRDYASIVRSLTWLMNEAIHHPAYLYYEGKPVILFAFQHLAGFGDNFWRELRDEFDPQHNTLWLAEGLSACCLYDGAMDGMYAFNMAWANGDKDFYLAERNLMQAFGGTFYLPSISPGWDEDKIAQATNRPNPTSRRERENGAFLARAWDAATATESDVILVVSWNEFVENSHIEPSKLYGTQSLDILRPRITEWRGFFPEPATPIPEYALFVDEPTPIYTLPDMEVIGELTPNSPYRIVGEDGGMYAVMFGDMMGYVSYQHITIRPSTTITLSINDF